MGTDIHIFFEKYDENEKQWFAARFVLKSCKDPKPSVLKSCEDHKPSVLKTIQILSDFDLDLLVKSEREDTSESFSRWEEYGLEFDTNRGYNQYGNILEP